MEAVPIYNVNPAGNSGFNGWEAMALLNNNRNNSNWGDCGFGGGWWAWIILLFFAFGGWGGGFGHGVGMSQYGADAIARLGFDYKTILRFYYRGAEITTLGV